MAQSKKKVVVIGGGNGSVVALRAFKKYNDFFDISAVISTSDSGGSSGKLRQEFGCAAYGDLLRAVLALSEYDFDIIKEIFYQQRYSEVGKLSDHNLGNLFLVLAGHYYSNDVMHAISALQQSIKSIGAVSPVSVEPVNLCAEMEDGEIFIGEHNIDRPKNGCSSTISKVWLDPIPEIFPLAKQLIEAADIITFGPGSFYCSVVPNLLVKGMQEAILSSRAKIVFITGKAYEEKGECGNKKLSHFVNRMQLHLPREINFIVANSAPLSFEQKEKYSEKAFAEIEFDLVNCANKNIIDYDYENNCGGSDYKKLGDLFFKLFSN
jgi:uncharacterized cofD-like protein